MTVWTRICRLWPWRKKGEAPPPPEAPKPLREFVYLDEVSLRSLLSSQKDGLTTTTSDEKSTSSEVELGSRLEATAPAVAKSELSSRFQTSNSSTIQTSRKATVQSWFGELLKEADLRKIEPVDDIEPVDEIGDVSKVTTASTVIRSPDLKRGDLVEFRVTLSADPVFRLETLVTEFAGMAEDFPGMFGADGAIEQLREVLPANKILQRLLAGLIPVRARTLDHVVATIDGTEYVVHRQVLKGHNVKTRPLELVGVTEHLAYWKDIRRVLFSDAEFVVLARVSRSGLHDSWTPVKLADLFKQLVPGLVDQITTASKIPMNFVADKQNSIPESDIQLAQALRSYANAILEISDDKPTREQLEKIEAACERLKHRSKNVTDQRSAFKQLHTDLSELIEFSLNPDQDLELRETARQEAGLSLFPQPASASPAPSSALPAPPDERLLDVEIIAIYW